MTKPKIYCYSNTKDGGDGVAYAMAEDGSVLGSHYCSSEHYVPYDLGLVDGSRPDRHETYSNHYPGGYEMEFVPASNVLTHIGLMAAYDLNQKQRRDREAEEKSQ